MSTSHRTRTRASGFTLIEVMIVVAIVAILASVALPAYTDYVRRGQLQEAFANLSNYRNRMEQYYQDNRRYAATAAETKCGGAAANALTAADLGGSVEFFTYSCTASNNGQNYTLTATGSSGTVTGNAYTINHNGDRGTTQFKGAASTATCWLSKGSTC